MHSNDNIVNFIPNIGSTVDIWFAIFSVIGVNNEFIKDKVILRLTLD